MPTFDRSTQQQVVEAVLHRLRAKIPECTLTTCFLCDQPQPVVWPSGSHCVVLSVSDGRFPEPFQAGGAYSTICEQFSVDLTIWVQTSLDKPGSFQVALLDPDCGLISYWKPALISAVLLDTDENGNPCAWTFVDEDGYGIWRNMPAVLSASRPMNDASGRWLGMTISFGFDIDWRL